MIVSSACEYVGSVFDGGMDPWSVYPGDSFLNLAAQTMEASGREDPGGRPVVSRGFCGEWYRRDHGTAHCSAAARRQGVRATRHMAPTISSGSL